MATISRFKKALLPLQALFQKVLFPILSYTLGITKIKYNALAGKRMIHAIQNGNLTEVKIALFFGADPNMTNKDETVLFIALEKGLKDIVKLLLDNGAEVNLQTKYSGQTALIEASEKGRLNVVKLLLA
ncbi:MAG: ankyrin repeat domain-containing protein [bacterium]